MKRAAEPLRQPGGPAALWHFSDVALGQLDFQLVIDQFVEHFLTRGGFLRGKLNLLGALRDVQELAGHRSIKTTQGYIEGDAEAQRKLIGLI